MVSVPVTSPVTCTYTAECLNNSRMPFEDFAAAALFKWELEASKQMEAVRKEQTEERENPQSSIPPTVCTDSATGR